MSDLPAAALSATLSLLRDLLGERLSTARAVCQQHGDDAGGHAGQPPDAVATPLDNDEVVAIVRACARHRVPVIPFGVGTSLEGHISALRGGVCIDLGQMNRVLEVNPADLDCRVQAGVTRGQLNQALRGSGLFFPIDPGADATLGGMAATRASGTNAVRYGTMREVTLGLTVVTADGRLIHTGGRARKSATGYDLTRLMVGSEGTLGVITELQLRLFGIPEAMSAATCAFADLAGAVDTVIQTIQLGVPVARIELLDAVQVRAVNAYSQLGLPEQALLLFEFHGSTAGVREQAETVGEIAAGCGGQGFVWAVHEEDRSRLWRARHDAYWAAKALRPGAVGLTTDVCVPISRLAECILETRHDIDASGLIAPIVGHVGDGNFHTVLLLDPDDHDEHRRAQAVVDRMVRRALDCGGTCSGEHGIGYGKIPYMEAEHGDAVAVMAQIKQALDPAGIMNPGKIIRLDGGP